MSTQYPHLLSAPNVPHRLQWTELWVFTALVIALLYALPAAFFSERLSLSPIKHLPFLVLLGGIALHAAGANIFHRSKRRNSIGYSLSFTILGLFAIAGSLFARYSNNIVDNYLTLGMYALIPQMLVYVFKRAFSLELFIEQIVKVWIFVSLICGIAVLARGYKTQAIHEFEFMVLPVLFYAITARSQFRWPGIIFFLVVIALNGKLTGYLVGGLCLLYSLTWESVRAEAENGLPTKGRSRFVKAALLYILIAGGAYYVMRDILPTGNPEVRMHQYDIAFDAIAKSPLFGDFFSGSSGTEYRETTASGLVQIMNIPTHSDLLDLLRHGGIAGFLLFMWGVWRTLKFSFSGISADSSVASISSFVRNVAFLELVCMSLVLVIAVNPVLLQPPLALVFWMSCGLVLAARC